MTQANLNEQNSFADITDPDVYVSGVPHATFERLRNEDPISWWDEKNSVETGGTGFWAVTRYHDILTVAHQPQLFSSARGIRMEDMKSDEMQARKTMMEMDPPEHTNYRRMVQPPFALREVAAYETALRLIARAVIDDVRGQTQFDFVEMLARRLPTRMLGKLLGVPDEDGPWLVKKGDALIGNADPEFTDTPVGLTDTEKYRLMPFRSPVSADLFQYAAEQAKLRRNDPKDDVISLLLKPKRDGEPLSEEEFKNFFTLLVAAGNDTTRYTMADGLHALLTHPEQLEKLRGNIQLMDTAVEEFLRWGTVTMSFRRTATSDTELSGKKIKSGDKLLLYYIAGDYDSRAFANPFDFDIERTPNEHLAFGLKSPHKCLGEHLARLEIKILFEELLPQLSSIQLAGQVSRLRSNFISGIKHLPVQVSWA